MRAFPAGVQGNKIFSRRRSDSRRHGSGLLTQAHRCWMQPMGHIQIRVFQSISGDAQRKLPCFNTLDRGWILFRVKNLMIGYNLPAGALLTNERSCKNACEGIYLFQNLLTLISIKDGSGSGTRKTTLTNGY